MAFSIPNVLPIFDIGHANVMERLLIYPENSGQLKQVKTYLTSMKIAFEVIKSTLPLHVMKGIEEGIEEDEAGQTTSFGEFKRKHFLSNK